jgi:hypothetical protein
MTTIYKCATCAADCNNDYSLTFTDIIAYGQTETITANKYFCAPWCRVLHLRNENTETFNEIIPVARRSIANMKIVIERGMRAGVDTSELFSVMCASTAHTDFLEKIMTGTMTYAAIKELAYKARRSAARAMDKIEEGTGNNHTYDYVTRIIKEMTVAIDDGNFGHWATNWEECE